MKRLMKRVLFPAATLTLAVLAQGPFGGSPGSGAARASDAPLQHALKEADCGSPEVKQIWQRGNITVYEANCVETSHRVLTILCDKQVCRVNDPEPEEEKEGR